MSQSPRNARVGSGGSLPPADGSILSCSGCCSESSSSHSSVIKREESGKVSGSPEEITDLEEEVTRICSARPSQLHEEIEKEPVTTQSIIVNAGSHRKSRLQNLLSPLGLPRLLGGRGRESPQTGCKMRSISVPAVLPSPISSPEQSPESSASLLTRPVRSATAQFIARARSIELDRDASVGMDTTWSMMPVASPAPGSCGGDYHSCMMDSHITERSGVPGAIQDFRRRLLVLFEEPFGSRSAWVLSIVLILINCTSFVLLCTDGPAIESSSSDRLVGESLHGQVQLVVNTICTFEALLRFWCSPHRRRSLGHLPNAIDASSVVPFWLIKVARLDLKIEWTGLYLVCRLEFGLRLLKLCRYFSGWQLLFMAMSDAIPALLLPLVALGLIVGLGACLILIAEEANTLAGGDPSTLTGFPDALMFCLLCIVAIDAGPFYELELRSKGGRLIVGVLMMCGLVVFAMPISIVGTCFCRVWFQRHRLLFLEALRRRVERETRTDTTTTLKELFDSFDRGHTGELGLQEFKWFTRSIVPWLSAATVLMIFSSFDQDQDGVVSFQEVQAAVFPEEADLEFLITVAEEKDSMIRSQEGGLSHHSEHTYESQALYESTNSGSSGGGETFNAVEHKSERSEDALQHAGSTKCRSSHNSAVTAVSQATSHHSAKTAIAEAHAAAATTASAVRLLGVLDNRLRSLEKRQCEIPITPWYSLGSPSPAKSLLSTRRNSLKSTTRGSKADHHSGSQNLSVHRGGHWSSNHSARSSKVSNLSSTYQSSDHRKLSSSMDHGGTLFGASQLPSASSSRCPSTTPGFDHAPGNHPRQATSMISMLANSSSLIVKSSSMNSNTLLPQIPDLDPIESHECSPANSTSRDVYWASSRRGSSGEHSMVETPALQEEDMMSDQEAWQTNKSVPVMQVTRTATKPDMSSMDNGGRPLKSQHRRSVKANTEPNTALAPPPPGSKRSVNRSSSPGRRVSKASANCSSRRMSSEAMHSPGAAVASYVRRLSAQAENETGDDLSLELGGDMWGMPARRADRRASSISVRPVTREVSSVHPSSPKTAASASSHGNAQEGAAHSSPPTSPARKKESKGTFSP